MKIFILSLIAFVVLNSCKSGVGNTLGDRVAIEIKSKPPKVKTYIAEYRNLDYIIETSGKIRAEKHLKVIAEMTGKLMSCNLENSSVVLAERVLLQYDLKTIDLQIEKVENAIFTSKMGFQSDVLSQESLLKGKTQGIRDTVYRKLKVDAGLSSAELELKDLLNSKEKALVRAPFTGIIADVKVHLGMYVRTGDELFTLYSHKNLFVDTKILESDVSLIRIGQLGKLTPISSEKTYDVRVSGINPLVDESGMVAIKLSLLSSDNLIPGMHGAVNIFIPSKNVLLIPKQALLFKNDRRVVFTLSKGLAKWNYVVVGRDNGEFIEILEGISDRDKVIISNNIQLSHDTQVEETQ